MSDEGISIPQWAQDAAKEIADEMEPRTAGFELYSLLLRGVDEDTAVVRVLGNHPECQGDLIEFQKVAANLKRIREVAKNLTRFDELVAEGKIDPAQVFGRENLRRIFLEDCGLGEDEVKEILQGFDE